MHTNKILLLFLTSLAWANTASAAARAIDTQKSVVTVRVFKAGVFSAFAHDHEISAPVASGSADTSAQRIELRIKAAALVVRDPKVSEKDRGEIQKTMLGPEVLDAQRHTEIVFESTRAESTRAESLATSGWRVHGNLTMHGQTRPVAVEVQEKGGHFTGHALLKQSEFGIKPVKVAGGTVRVKNEIQIEFDIQLAP